MNVQRQVTELLDQMRALVANDPREFEHLSDQIEVLVRGYCMPTVDETFLDLHMTETEQRIMHLLHARLGKIVCEDAIMDALYFDRPDDEPQPKIIQVLICKMRKKLVGTKWRIDTIWGQGVRLLEMIS